VLLVVAFKCTPSRGQRIFRAGIFRSRSRSEAVIA